MRKHLLQFLALSGLLFFPTASTAQRNQVSRDFYGKIQRVETSLSNVPHASERKTSAVSGAITPSWSTDFTSEADFNRFTVIDANNDAKDNGGLKEDAWNYKWGSLYFYSVSNKADDWLISPAFNLKGGRSYKVKLTINCFREHKVEIKWGKEATIAAMTGTGLKEQTFKTNTTLEATVAPTEDGVYYVGIHVLSEKAGYNMYVRNFSIDAMAEPKAPGEPTNLVITPDASAALKATLTFTAPKVSLDNNELSSLTGIKIQRNGKQIANITNAKPGEGVTYIDDKLDSAGLTAYTLTPYNEYGDGTSATAEKYVGLDKPGAPQNRVLTADLNKLHFTWDAPSGAHNGIIFTKDINYDIYDVQTYQGKAYLSEKLGSVKGSTAIDVDKETETGNQRYQYLAVGASNSAGKSDAYISTPVLVGEAYALPFRETFAGSSIEHFWAESKYGNGDLYEPKSGVYIASDTDADGDGSSVYLRTVVGDSVSFFSGKISLANATNPQLSFRFKSDATQGTFSIFVSNAKGEKTVLAEEVISKKDSDWILKQYDLSKFISERWIEVGFNFADLEGWSEQVVRIDNIHVSDLKPTDLAVTLSASKEVEKGKEAKINIKVDNYGSEPADNYNLIVSVGGKEVANESVSEAIPSFGYKKYSFDFTTSLLDLRDSLDVKVNLTINDDVNNENNIASAIIRQHDPELLPAENIHVEKNAKSNSISWTEPSKLRSITEDFESYPVWEVEKVGDWTLVDGDKGECHGLVDNSYIYYTNENYPFAFIVFNPTVYGDDKEQYDIRSLYPCVTPKSGNQSLAAFYSYSMNYTTYTNELKDADNWLISPELPGDAQTISFSANNFFESGEYQGTPYAYDYPETFEVMYSQSDKDTTNFVKLGDTYKLENGKWQDFTVNLPAGTKYFAIHHNSKAEEEEGYPVSPFMFALDDIKYNVANYTVLHYNVYRDGKLIGSPTDTFFTDNEATGEHVYQVTVVYEGNVESKPITYGLTTSINSVYSSSDNSLIESIYTLDGRRVSSITKGVYVVKYNDGTIRKVAK